MVSKRGLTKGPAPPSDTLSLSITIKPKYPAKQHARAVAAKLPPTATGSLIYLPGQPSLLNEDSDQPQPFRQRRYFHYLSGVVDLPDCAVTYDSTKDELVLYIPPLDPREVLWTGMPKSRAECLAEYDVDDVRHSTQLGSDLKMWGKRTVQVVEKVVVDQTGRARRKLEVLSPTVYVLSQEHIPEELVPLMMEGGCTSGPTGGIDFSITVDAGKLKPTMDDCRVYKDAYELGLLRQAIAVTKAAHENVISLLRQPSTATTSTPSTEADLEAAFRATCISLGCKNQAYEPIVCSGRNCATLHYTANNAPLANKQLLLIDAGCEYRLYCADITRTYPISGTFTPEAKQIYDIVERMQREAIAQTLDGVGWRRTHFLAARIATEGLRALGILRGGTVEEIFKAGTWRAFFPHGLGHMIGLETHDVEGTRDDDSGYDPHMVESRGLPFGEMPFAGQRRKRRGGAGGEGGGEFNTMINRVLRAGMVVTVEPGIYFCEWIVKPYLTDLVHGKYINSDVLERYWDVGGVRIEDMVAITKTGNEVLSRDIPRGF